MTIDEEVKEVLDDAVVCNNRVHYMIISTEQHVLFTNRQLRPLDVDADLLDLEAIQRIADGVRLPAIFSIEDDVD